MINNAKQVVDTTVIILKKMEKAGFTEQLEHLKREQDRFFKEVFKSIRFVHFHPYTIVEHWEKAFPNDSPSLSSIVLRYKGNATDMILRVMQNKLNRQYSKTKLKLKLQNHQSPEKTEAFKTNFYNTKFTMAIKHVKNDTLLGGSTYGPDAVKSGSYALQKERIKQTRNMDIFYPTEAVHLSPKINSMFAINTKARAGRSGNCAEMAALMAEYLWKNSEGITRIENVSGNLIGSLPHPKGFDHVFCIVNRKPNSSLADPSTWGNQTYIVDPWSSQYFKVNDYKKTMRQFLHNAHEASKLFPRDNKPWQISSVPTQDILLDLSNKLDINPAKTPYDDQLSTGYKTFDSNHLNQYKIDHQKKFSSSLDIISKDINDKLMAFQKKDDEYTKYHSIQAAILKGDLKQLKNLHPHFNQLILLPKQFDSFKNTSSQRSISLLHLAINLAQDSNPVIESLIADLLASDKSIDLNDALDLDRNALCLAIAFQNPALVHLFLNQGADPQKGVQVDNQQPISPLYLAAQQGNIEILESIFKADNSPVDSHTFGGATPLLAAVKHGHLEAAQFLIQKGANVNIKDDSGQTPLWAAAHNGDLDMLKCLLSHHANPNMMGQGQQTPFYAAAKNGHLDILKELSQPKYKVDVNTPCSCEDDRTPLLIAIENYHINCSNLMMDLPSIDLDLASKSLNTCPLKACIDNNWFTLVDKCLSKGANPNKLLSSDQEHYLSELIRRYNFGPAISLIKHGITINDISGGKFKSPLQVALELGLIAHIPITQLLLDHKADIHYVTKDHTSCLTAACASTSPDFLALEHLFKKGADPNKPIHAQAEYPLKTAYMNDQFQLLKYLLEHNADPLLPRFDSNKSILHMAAIEGKDQELALILKYIQPKSKALSALNETITHKGESLNVIELACKENQYYCVKALLEYDLSQIKNVLEKFTNHSKILDMIPYLDIVNTPIYHLSPNQKPVSLLEHIEMNQSFILLFRLLTSPDWKDQFTPELTGAIRKKLDEKFPGTEDKPFEVTLLLTALDKLPSDELSKKCSKRI